MAELEYTRNGDYLIPNLELNEMTGDIGKYGSLRRTYLKEHRKGLYSGMLLSGKLWPHLTEINQAAQERVDRIVSEMAAREGVTEALKASDQMEWVRRMNNLKAAAEEIVLSELVYC